MLPNVVGSKFDERTSSDLGRLRLPTTGNGSGGRRALSSKSAHLTTIPFEPSFVSPSRSQKQDTQKRPYLPFSASPSRQRSNNIIQQPTTSATGWRNGGGTNGLKLEYSYRARAHSHKNARVEASNGTNKKSMPHHLIDSRRSATRKQCNASQMNESNALLDSSNAQEQCTRQSLPEKDANEMVMMGTAKSSLVGGGSSVPLIASKVQSTKDRFQVCRTKEEKEKSPDCIRLDKCALRFFPDIGGGESVTLKMLSLQHNLITRLENVPLLSQLVVLDLYDNRVERICGLQGLPSLRVLLLGKNRIKRIEGMDNLKRLEILDLHGNQLRYVDNLGPLSSLRVLNLAGNLLRNIRTLGPYGMSSLTELNLKRNRIKSLDGLQKAPHLKRLLIANNELQNIATLAPLRKLLFLDELVVDPNPITSSMNSSEYKNQVLTLFPNLGSLDRSPVTDEMKVEARQWHKAKLAEEEARKKEEARIRQEMVATIGPPGSREQVIYQARRRWESLRNFVKSTNPTVSVEVKPKPIKHLRDAASATISAKSNVKPRPNFSELYPPATLDLENFPDGQAELEKTESLLELSNKHGNSHLIEAGMSAEKVKTNQINLIAEEPNSDVSSSNHFHNELISALGRLPFSQTAPSDEASKDNESKGAPPNSRRLLIATKIATDIPFQPETLNKCNAHSSVKSEDSQIANACKESEEIMNSARSNLSIASSKTPDNKPSAKVAVVRPLIREAEEESKNSPNVDCGITSSMSGTQEARETFPSPNDMSNDGQPKSKDSPSRPLQNEIVSSCPNTDNDKEERSSNGNGSNSFGVETENVLSTEGNLSNSNSQAKLNTTLRESTILPTSVSTSQKFQSCAIEIETNKDKDGQVEAKEEALVAELKDASKFPSSSENLPSSSPSSYQTRVKLLRHLRSMSLDSGMEPMQAIDSQTELCNGNPEEDVEDEEDNDNEVKDLECDYDYDEDVCSVSASTVTTGTSASTTPRRSSTVIATTNRLLKSSGSFRKQTFPRTKSQRMRLRDRAAKLFGSSSDLSPRSNSTMAKRTSSGLASRTSESQGASHSLKPSTNGKTLRRCDSANNLSSQGAMAPTSTSTTASASVLNGAAATSKASGANGNVIDDLAGTPYRKQGVDFLVEIEGKGLNVFGQGGLRHALTAFTSNVTCHVNVAKFHYITFDSIIPFFGKLRQVYPSLEHFHFRANNLCTLAQLDALSDLQGLSSLCIAKEGNPIVTHEAWAHYASYRLSHWGLQVINGKEISSEYRGGVAPAAQSKCFESLGFLALSCLPQTALTPLAKRLHMLHCFCCCSPSTSSDESNRAQRLMGSHSHRLHSPSQQADHASSGNFCTAWDDDPVLLDVIGKEALVYCPPPLEVELNSSSDGNTPSTSKDHDKISEDRTGAKREHFEKKRLDTLKNLIKSGVEIAEKVDRLERTWPTLLTDVIQEILMDYRFMDSYMKKELKKAQDATLIASNNHNHSQQHHGKKIRH